MTGERSDQWKTALRWMFWDVRIPGVMLAIFGVYPAIFYVALLLEVFRWMTGGCR